MRMRTLVLWMTILAGASAQTPRLIQAPRFWNDRELSDWATPLAALNVRPGHFSEREYYASPDAEWVRTERAVPGHPFGLNLSADDKAALIAFLRTL